MKLTDSWVKVLSEMRKQGRASVRELSQLESVSGGWISPISWTLHSLG